jgi:ribosomal protein S6--L-glutamate ligase
VKKIWLLTDARYLGQRMPSALADWLEAVGHPAETVVADDLDTGSAIGEQPWHGLEPGDVVVARSRHPYALSLLQLAEAFGARLLDPWPAVAAVRDKLRCSIGLARQGVPTPPTFVARRPADLAGIGADAFPLILKPVLGDNGLGLRVVASREELADLDWPEDVVLAQSYLDAAGIDLKVYVAGDAIWAVRRPSPLSAEPDVPLATPVTARVRALAHACRAEFGLSLFGLDVLELEEGPVVVDVNEFPNYTGVDAAPAAIGRAVLGLANLRAREGGVLVEV